MKKIYITHFAYKNIIDDERGENWQLIFAKNKKEALIQAIKGLPKNISCLPIEIKRFPKKLLKVAINYVRSEQ